MPEIKKYYLENLDCADCAARIEDRVRGLDGVRFASLNFSTATLHLEADDLDPVRQAIRQVDPDVEMHADQQDKDEAGLRLSWELATIGAAIILFVLGIIFRQRLHATPYMLGEYAVLGLAYLLSGWGVLYKAARNLRRGNWFDETFLMSVATLGAFAIHELPEAVGVMLFYKIGEFVQELSVSRSRRTIQSLLEVRPQQANLKTEGKVRAVSPERVGVGETIVVRPGERVPLDGVVLEGSSQLDTAALTGESLPQSVEAGDEVLAGMINKTSLLALRVTKPFAESSIARMLELVQNAAARKARTEKFITRFAHYYTPVVVLGALGVAFIPPLLLPGAALSEWVYRALVLLVISCPCALMISIPLGYFGGVGGASRRGILVKGANFLDVLAEVKTVVFDKTGTLTRGDFRVTEVVSRNGYNEDELLRIAAVAESQSNHPIALSIRQAYGAPVGVQDLEVYEELPGYGVHARVDGKRVLVGNDTLMHRERVAHDHCEVGGTALHLAVDGAYAGYLVISDELKPGARGAIQALRETGVERVVMLTGDRGEVAASTAMSLGVEDYRAELLPEHKVDAVEGLLDGRGNAKVAYVGDGINDAPVIARADVGIAMGGMGSDAAIETADVVLMTDDLSKVSEAIRLGRRTRSIVWQNIGLALGVKGLFVVLGMAGLASMWAAVFADVGVTLLAVFNATRVLR